MRLAPRTTPVRYRPPTAVGKARHPDVYAAALDEFYEQQLTYDEMLAAEDREREKWPASATAMVELVEWSEAA